jgi:hypothetical protein
MDLLPFLCFFLQLRQHLHGDSGLLASSQVAALSVSPQPPSQRQPAHEVSERGHCRTPITRRTISTDSLVAAAIVQSW